MKSKLKIFAVVLASLILAFFVMVALRPATFRVTRTATFAAPPEKVFAQVNNLHHWNDWSPWKKLDPNATNILSGPESGVGARFAWSGNNKVGEGHMTITDSRTNERVEMELVFLKPFAAVSTTEFLFKPEGDSTVVTWSMFGKNNFMAKAVGMFFDTDAMVGGSFDEGFSNLKTIVEKPSENKQESE